MSKPKILIAEDNIINRAILAEILKDEYFIIKAKNGKEALSKIGKYKDSLNAILLDLMMPKIDGFTVLEKLKENKLTEKIPVVIISGEDSIDNVIKCFDLGAQDFIAKPFDRNLVLKRVENATIIYEKSRKLYSSFLKEFIEREKQVDLLISTLANVVEFRNAETGPHILHIKIITNILLEELMKIAPKYNLNLESINAISNASALHDIGKVAVPEEILNKPGQLTDEEFEQIKIHPIAGALIIDKLEEPKKEELLIKYAYQICR